MVPHILKRHQRLDPGLQLGLGRTNGHQHRVHFVFQNNLQLRHAAAASPVLYLRLFCLHRPVGRGSQIPWFNGIRPHKLRQRHHIHHVVSSNRWQWPQAVRLYQHRAVGEHGQHHHVGRPSNQPTGERIFRFLDSHRPQRESDHLRRQRTFLRHIEQHDSSPYLRRFRNTVQSNDLHLHSPLWGQCFLHHEVHSLHGSNEVRVQWRQRIWSHQQQSCQ